MSIENSADETQALCELGSEQLQRTEYIEAERSLERAETLALAAKDFDTLARLYFPLQEARRQRRQRCGEGTVRLDLAAKSPADVIDPVALADRYPHGQLLVAGWQTTAPAEALRRIYGERGVYAEVLLGAAFSAGQDNIVVAVTPFPADLAAVPAGASIDQLQRLLPPHACLMSLGDLPAGDQAGTPATFARTMELWERLHLPFLAMARSMPLSEAKLDAFRRVTEVDYACERAHQEAAFTARDLARRPS